MHRLVILCGSLALTLPLAGCGDDGDAPIEAIELAPLEQGAIETPQPQELPAQGVPAPTEPAPMEPTPMEPTPAPVEGT